MLFITEFQFLPRDAKPPYHPMQLANLGAVVRNQALAIGGSSTPGVPMMGTNYVRVIASAACYIKAGSSPTATTADTYLAAGVPEYFAVKPGHVLAVIEAA